MKVEIIDALHYPGWDELLLSTPGASFFHSSPWARVLSEAYGYTPFYFSIIGDRKFRALVPIMEVNSLLTGKRGVSLPFTDYCEPILDETIPFQDLFSQIIEYGKKRGWKYIELRGGNKYRLTPWALRIVPFRSYFGHTLDLTKGEEKILAGLRDSTRRNIKKATTQKVRVKISNDTEAIKGFFRLNCLTRKEHGLPPQPYRFFERIYEHVISRGLGFVILASCNGHEIAGAVFFHFGDKGIYKYGASEKGFQGLRGNNLVMWEGIRWFCNNGYRSLSLGRTELENQGLQQFKNGWGTDKKTLCYHRYDVKSMEFIAKQAKVNSFANKLFNGMPTPVLKLAGSLLYRHIG